VCPLLTAAISQRALSNYTLHGFIIPASFPHQGLELLQPLLRMCTLQEGVWAGACLRARVSRTCCAVLSNNAAN
jgi:hypothetical protein